MISGQWQLWHGDGASSEPGEGPETCGENVSVQQVCNVTSCVAMMANNVIRVSQAEWHRCECAVCSADTWYLTLRPLSSFLTTIVIINWWHAPTLINLTQTAISAMTRSSGPHHDCSAVYRNQSVSLQTLSSVTSKEFDERGFDDLKSLMDEKSKLIPGPKKRYRIIISIIFLLLMMQGLFSDFAAGLALDAVARERLRHAPSGWGGSPSPSTSPPIWSRTRNTT